MAVIGGSSIRRAAKITPTMRMALLGGSIAMMAGQHVAALEPAERRRLVALLRKRAARAELGEDERRELDDLVAKLQPRLFVGKAARRLSPVPIPKRVLYGRRGSPAREALRGRR